MAPRPSRFWVSWRESTRDWSSRPQRSSPNSARLRPESSRQASFTSSYVRRFPLRMTLSERRDSTTSNSGEIVIQAVIVSRSTSWRRLQRSPLRRSGSMGMASSGK